MPHAVQLPVVLSGASQPLDALKSQLPKPIAQLTSEHVPVEQLSVAFVSAQAVLHAPQWVRELSAVSQPF